MKGLILILMNIVIFIEATAYGDINSDAVQNLISTSHIIGEPANLSQINFSWDAPLSSQWNGCSYFILFDQNNDDNFTFTTENISGSPINGRSTIIPCEGDNDSYFFHIAPAVFSFSPLGYLLGTTQNIGPFKIDTTPPFNQKVLAPEYTSDEMVPLTLSATGATKVCISNVGLGDCSVPWSDYSSFYQWQLLPNDGIKNIFVQFKDGAGNTADALATTQLLSENLTIKFAVRSQSFQNNKFTLDITFSQPVTGFDISDIQTHNCEANNFVSYGISPFLSFSIDISIRAKEEYWIKIPENAAFDNAGNGNIEAIHHFIYSVPTLSEWGLLLMFCILGLLGVKYCMERNVISKQSTSSFNC